MQFSLEQLQAILVGGNYLSQEDFDTAAAEARTARRDLVNYLLEEDILDLTIFGQALAEFYKLPFIDLAHNMPEEALMKEIPEQIARTQRVILFKKEKQKIYVATDQPETEVIENALVEVFPKKTIVISYALKVAIDSALLTYKEQLDTRFDKIIEGKKKVAPEILEEIIADALVYRASDIHMEPMETETIVRFRIDGLLQEVGTIPKGYYENILNKIKIQANLRIDEHRAMQDGAMRFEYDGAPIDVRVSIAPTVWGEKVVFRVISSYVKRFSLRDLGMSEKDRIRIAEASRKPFGMILVVGPTGSGKTTTLYATLEAINQRSVNITTIEDPVEYKMPGVNQIQVNGSAHITFAQGLRTIVRQDPDVILVGEIRDTETAEIAVNAALTGHLLFSTFHANDAATAIPRLIDMGVEPFLLASTLDVIIAQRLVRQICSDCRVSYTPKAKDLSSGTLSLFKKVLKKKTVPRLYKGAGCERCSQTGYSGRTAIFELIEMNPNIMALISDHPTSTQIWQAAEANGARSLFEDGLEKVLAGMTTMEELLRVVEVPKKYRK